MKWKILTLGAGIALAAGAAAFAGDAPAGADQRTEERVVIICDGGPGGHGGPHGPGGEHGEMHGKMDANNDGSISRDEFRAMHDDMFGKLDKNHDGKLSGDEFGHGPGGPGGGEHFEMRIDGPGGHHGPGGPDGMGAGCHPGGPGDVAWTEHGGPDGPGDEDVRIIRRGPGDDGPGHGPDEMDANKDGKLSFEEFSAPMREHFNEADKNHNGFLDKDEMGGDRQFVFRHVERH